MIKKNFKWLPALIASILLLAVVAAGCSSGSGTKDTQSLSPTNTGNSSPTNTANKEPRKELTMFMGSSGLGHPPNVNPSDNPYINIIKDIANVDLKIEIPPWSDYQTKLNLLLSSGKLPDIVHSNDPDPAYKAARDGAFIDLKKYYDKSPIVQKVITPEMMELAKDPVSGNYWRIPMAWDKSPQGAGIYARYDLIQKYNGGKWPESVPEWVDLMRKIKKAEPSAVVMSNRVTSQGIAYGGTPIYAMYGALPYQARMQNGKLIPTILLPEYKAATQVMKQLYDEGILDKEFATSDTAKWDTKWATQTVLFQYNTNDQLADNAVAGYNDPKIDQKSFRLAFAPPLKQYPPELKDPKYAQSFTSLPIQSHGLYISSASKDPDRAWKVIEAFASEQLHEAIFWGKEGETYTVKDGKRIPIPAKLSAEDRRWVLHLALLFGFVDGQEVKKATNALQLPADYYKLIYDSVQTVNDGAVQNGLGKFPGYAAPDDANKKAPEAMQEVTRITEEAIMGKITMDQFDQEVKKWDEKYTKVIYQPLEQYILKNKDKLKNLGVKQVDW